MHFSKKLHTQSAFQTKKYALFFPARQSSFFSPQKVHTFPDPEAFWYAPSK